MKELVIEKRRTTITCERCGKCLLEWRTKSGKKVLECDHCGYAEVKN